MTSRSIERDSAQQPPELGTLPWLERTGGQLTRGERRHLLGPLAVAHASSLTGRLGMLLRLDAGRRRDPALGRRALPDSSLTQAALAVARRRLTPALLNHSYRTFLFGAALGELDGLDVDREVLLAAALLHDVGLPTQEPLVDFTRASARAAREVAEQVGLSTVATRTLRTAITLHHTPRVSLAHGPVAHLLAAGAALDVVGQRVWQLPPELVADVVAAHPRLGLKRELTAAFRAEAIRVPHGRIAFLRRYGALDLAVRAAPFRG